MTFKSIAEFLDPKNGQLPTTAERKLIAATQAGVPCILGDPSNPSRPTGPSDETTVRASLLRLLILGGTKECGLHERGVWLGGGWIEGKLDLAFCIGKGQIAICNCQFTDQPSLTQTTLLQLSLDKSAFPGLFAQGARISGGLFLRFVTSTQTVAVNGASIGGQLACVGATLDGGKVGGGGPQDALNAQGVEVGKSFILSQIIATGTVDISSAKVGGLLDCEGATFDGGMAKGGVALLALNAQGLGVKHGFVFRELARVQGVIDLSAANVGDLVDDAASWPVETNSLILDGFTYDRIAGSGPTTFSARRDWLASGSLWQEEFNPQPYTQLAKVLRQMGHAGEARQVLMERERLLAVHRLESDRKDFMAAYDGGVISKGDSGKIWLRMRGAQFWAWLTGKVAGYGYAPQRALYCALACIGGSFFAYMLFWQLGAMVPTDAVILTSVEWQSAFDLDGLRPALVWADPSRSGPATSHYETYYSLPYALDVFLPIVDLGQQSTWGQTTVTNLGVVARIYTWLLQAAGYIITSLGLAAATGIIQRNQPD